MLEATFAFLISYEPPLRHEISKALENNLYGMCVCLGGVCV